MHMQLVDAYKMNGGGVKIAGEVHKLNENEKTLDLSNNSLGIMEGPSPFWVRCFVFEYLRKTMTSLILSDNDFSDDARFLCFLENVPLHIIDVDLRNNSKLNDGKYKYLLKLPLSVQTVKISNETIIMKDFRLMHAPGNTAAELAKIEASAAKVEAGMETNSNVKAEKIPQTTSSIQMKVLIGFIAAIGIAAVALAFAVFNAAALSGLGLGMAGAGIATLIGLGLFAATCRKNTSNTVVLTSIPDYPKAYARHHESLDDEGADSYGLGTM